MGALASTTRPCRAKGFVTPWPIIGALDWLSDMPSTTTPMLDVAPVTPSAGHERRRGLLGIDVTAYNVRLCNWAPTPSNVPRIYTNIVTHGTYP